MQDWERMLKVSRQSKVPLYHQIIENFRDLIVGGLAEPGEAVPSEWELASFYRVSRLTVRRALDDLVRDGLVIRRHGVGTFVAHLTEAQILPSELSFSKNMERIGRTPSSRLVSLRVVSAAPEIAQHLDLEPDEPVFELVRVRLADNNPLMLETTYVSKERFPDLNQADLASGSLYSFLSTRYQVDIVALDQTMEPTQLTSQEADLLFVQPGSPAILSEVVGFTGEGAPVEYTWSVTRGGVGRFYFHFREGDVGSRHFTETLSSGIQRR